MTKYINKPYTKEFILSKLSNDDIPIIQIGLLRSKYYYEKYEELKRNTKNMNTYVYNHELNKFKDNNLLLKPNPFPYNLEYPLKNYILWTNKNLSKKEIIIFLEKKNITDYIIFVNTPINKSVKYINHYHIIF